MKIEKKTAGVRPTDTGALDPRQQRFIDYYLNPKSNFFGNCYKAALSAGYSHETARNLTHNKPKWLSEKLGQMQTLEPDLLLAKLADIISSPKETTQIKLKAIEMMMKYHHMFGANNITAVQFNIQSILD